MPTDAELLHAYVATGDEPAFTELVRRHLGLVYAAALRRTGGNDRRAEEIAQEVFTRLAARAASLLNHPALPAWLYSCIRTVAIDAVRAEQRRQRLAERYAAMPEDPASPTIDWERLRLVLDESVDQLPERDRQLVLLRFFSGLSFAELGARLKLSENTARMRTSRALDRLHAELSRRGVTSSAAALTLALANPVLASVPSGLTATVVSAAALTAAPGAAATTIVGTLLMSKITAPAFATAIAIGLTAIVWTTTTSGVDSSALATLREENARLSQSRTQPPPDPLTLRTERIAQAAEAHRAARTSSEDVSAISGANNPSPGASATPRGHRYRGTATPLDAAFSFAWACDTTDADAVAKLIWFEPEVRARAAEILTSMPPSIRDKFPTPEAFYGLMIAADSLIFPPPVPELASRFEEVELREGRVAFRLAGSKHNFHEYQFTGDGWKFVMPLAGVERWAENLNNPLLVKLAAQER